MPFAALCAGIIALSLCAVFARLQPLFQLRTLARDQAVLQIWSKRLADAAFDGLLIHRNGIVLSMNRSLQRLLGYRESELLGQHFATLAPPAQAAGLRAELEYPAGEISEFTLLTVDKAERYVELSSQSIAHEGQPATVTAIRDITRARADRERIELLLHYDPMTGLANRALFSQTLAAAVELNDRAGGATALFLMDIDQLSALNERIGRAGGDELLRQIANRIKRLTGEADMAARINGDKFAILQPHDGAPDRAQALAAKLEDALAQAFTIGDQTVKISTSMGMAVYPDHAVDAEGLLNAANFALRRAPQTESGVFRMFSHAEFQAAEAKTEATEQAEVPQRVLPFRHLNRPALHMAAQATAPALGEDLRAAVPRGEISLEYQPVFRSSDLGLAGFEALARWRHPLHGWIPPSTFIPLAESAGVIHDIGNFVMEAASARAAANLGGDYVIAVNLSPVQFRDKQLAPKISEILRRTGLKPSLLELEVTESLLIEDAEAALASLKATREIGVRVALDDFGTGYSSLSYLCDFPFTRLKIDKRFVHALGKDQNAEAVITAILSLARSLKLEVTSEGVETLAQLSILKELGCELVQGFLLGRPGTHVANMPALVKPAGPLFSARAGSRKSRHLTRQSEFPNKLIAVDSLPAAGHHNLSPPGVGNRSPGFPRCNNLQRGQPRRRVAARAGIPAIPDIRRQMMVIATIPIKHRARKPARHRKTQLARIKRLRGRQRARLQMHMAHHRRFWHAVPCVRASRLKQPIRIQGLGRHFHHPVHHRPLIARPVAINLNPIALRIGQINRLAHQMVGSALQRNLPRHRGA
jgi:diguanylate cyclase (GGDEF)-like protein/PAS domain S-box-containing protein